MYLILRFLFSFFKNEGLKIISLGHFYMVKELIVLSTKHPEL